MGTAPGSPAVPVQFVFVDADEVKWEVTVRGAAEVPDHVLVLVRYGSGLHPGYVSYQANRVKQEK